SGGTNARDTKPTPAPSADPLEANYEQAFTFPLATQKPLIAAVNGPAAGIGMILSLYCDLRFGSDNARFGTAFSPLGLIAQPGMSWILPAVVGMGNAMDLLYSARVIDAQEALRMGLLQRVYPQAELLDRAREYVNVTLARSSPKAMQVTKRLAWNAQFQDL